MADAESTRIPAPDATVEPRTRRMFVALDRRGRPACAPFRDPYAAYMKALAIGGYFVAMKVTDTQKRGAE